MKPNLPPPPQNLAGFKAVALTESDIAQDPSILERFQYAELVEDFPGEGPLWFLYRNPNQ